MLCAAGLTSGLRVLCRYRHGQPLLAAEVRCHDDQIQVSFEESQWAVQRGQVIAFYNREGEVCLGGAIIAGAC